MEGAVVLALIGLRYPHSFDKTQRSCKRCFTVFCEAEVSLLSSRPIHAKMCLSYIDKMDLQKLFSNFFTEASSLEVLYDELKATGWSMQSRVPFVITLL